MVVRAHVEKNTYADSVRLMQVGRLLREQPGIADAGVVMGTPANLASLAEAALLAETAAAAGPNDLVLAVRATEVAAAEAALHSAMAALHQHAPGPTH